MNKYNFYYGQYPTEGQFDDAFKRVEQAVGNIISGITGENKGLLTRSTIPYASATPDFNLTIPQGEGYIKVTDYIQETDSYEYLARLFWNENILLNLENDYQGNPVTPSAGLKRYIAVLVKFVRDESEEVTDFSGQTLFYRQFEGVDFVVHMSEESSNPVKITIPEDSVLICDILIDENISSSGVQDPQDYMSPGTNEIDITRVNWIDMYKKKDFITSSSGITSQGKPILLNSEGKVDDSFLPEKNIVNQDNILSKNRTHFITESTNLTLPDTVTEGDSVEIFLDAASKIIQDDPEHAVSYLNKYYTTKGAEGSLILPSGSHIKLIYKGGGVSKNLVGVKLSDPPVLPTGTCFGCTFSYNTKYLVMGYENSPFLTILKRTGDTFNEISSPDVLPLDTVLFSSFSYDDKYLAIGHASSPYITIYKRTGDTFTKLPDPDILPINSGLCCTFSYDSNYLVVVYDTSPYFSIYKRSGDNFYKLPDPDTLIPDKAICCTFSYDNKYLAIGHHSAPFITLYKKIGDNFIKLPDPDTLPTGAVTDCSFSFDGMHLAASYTETPYFIMYKKSGDTFSKIQDPDILPPNVAYTCNFSYNGNYLVVGHLASPYFILYKRSGNTYIKMPDPDILPTTSDSFLFPYSASSSFSHDGRYLALGLSSSPYIAIYKLVEDVFRAWIVEEFNTLYKQDLEYLFK